MEVLKFTAGAYLTLYAMLIIAGAIERIKINDAYRWMAIGVAISVAVFGFCLEPTTDLDLYRLHRYASSMDFEKGNILSSILGKSNNSVLLSGTSLTGMISFNMLCYIIHLLGDVHWMSAIGCFVTFAVVLSLITDYVIEKGGNSRFLFISVVITFMGMQVNYVMQGIRNTIAVALCVWGLYLLFYKKRSPVLPVILFFTAVTMHATVLIVLPIVLFSKMKNQKLIRIIALFTMPIIFWLATQTKGVNLGFINYLSNRILFYTDVSYEFDRPELIADIAIYVITALSFWFQRSQGLITVESKTEKCYINAYILLGLAMISFIQRRDFALRIGYLMGIGAIPLLYKLIFKKNVKISRNRIFDAVVLVTAILICGSKVAYDMIYVFSRWKFN